jgi:hypothetical protein
MKSPKKERLEVGLDRKRERLGLKLPSWLEENLGTLFVGSAVFCVVLTSFLLSSTEDGERPRPTRRDQQAHLAAIIGPLKTFAPGSAGLLEKLSMTIKNMGPAEAENVLVFGLVGNDQIALEGPKTLKMGEQQEYSLAAPVSISPKSSIVMRFVCWNCPLTPGPSPSVGGSEPVGFEKERLIMEGKYSPH